MQRIQIMTDAASDISAEDERTYGIRVLPFSITIADRTYLSRVDFDNDRFYTLLAQTDEIPKTAQITPFQFQQIYLREAEAGTTDLILVLINAKASSTYANSLLAVDLFYNEYPQYRDRFRIHSLDGIGYNAMYGAPVVQAAKMCAGGAGVEQILQYLRRTLPRQEALFGIYDLKYAALSGRIPTAAAFLGTKLNLKPVMRIFGGEIATAAKCRGEHKLIETIARMSVEEMEPGTPYLLGYGCDKTCLEQMRQQMVQLLGYGASGVYQIGAAIAVNSGPRVVGVLFTRRGEAEK